nr:MAG TPA: helix-turn-helix domain protein [Caudoviricetes sp.]
MSYAAIDWAMPKVIKDVNAKSCLVVLAYHHNKETGLCCPSISTIADEMGVRSLNTVRKAIGVLVEMNLLTMSREFGGRGEILSTRYTLNLQSEAFKPVKKKKGVVHDMKEGHEVNEGHEVKEVHDMKEGGSPNEGGVVHLVQGGSSSHEGGVVHVVNPNKEVEQGKEQITGTEKETGNSLPDQAPWETDHFDDDVKKIEKPKKERAKPKTSCPFSPDDPIPPEYLEYAQAKHPSINAQTEFTKFVNFHLSKDNRYSNWLAAWRTWATKAEEFAKSRPQSQNQTFPFGKPTDPQYGIGVCERPKVLPREYTPEESRRAREEAMKIWNS